MAIIQKDEKKYLEQGISSIKEYKINELEKEIDEIIVSQRNKLNFKGTAKNFKKNALKFAGIYFGGKKAILNFLNKNEYIGETAKLMESYLSQNPALVEIGLNTIESALKVDIKDLGFEKNSYKQILKALQKKGFVGKESGLDIIVDKLMNNTENVVTAASNVLGDKWDADEINEFISSTGITIKGVQEAYKKGGFKEKNGVFNYATDKIMENLEDISALILQDISEEKIRGMSISQVGEIVSSDLGITIKGIQKAYKESGFKGEKGVVKYLSDSLVINGIKKIYNDILPPGFDECNVRFTSEDMIKAYKNDGIVGKNGLVYKAVGFALWQVPFLDQWLYSQILNFTEFYKRKKETKIRGDDSFPGIDFLGNNYLANLESKFKTLSKVPRGMSQAKFEAIYNSQGVFGDKGLISYLSKNIPLIFENAKKVGALDEDDVKSLNEIVKKISILKSPEKIKWESRNKYDWFAVNIAKKSEEMKIDTKELLGNPEYIGVRKEIIEQIYGSIEEYTEKYEAFQQGIEELLKNIPEMKGNLDAKDIIEEIQHIRPNGFLGVIVDKLAAKYINKTIVSKADDYINLTKALIEQQLEKTKKEVQAYKAVKS